MHRGYRVKSEFKRLQLNVTGAVLTVVLTVVLSVHRAGTFRSVRVSCVCYVESDAVRELSVGGLFRLNHDFTGLC